MGQIVNCHLVFGRQNSRRATAGARRATVGGRPIWEIYKTIIFYNN